MKHRTLLSIAFAVSALIVVSSCQKEESDIFEKPSSDRVSDYLASFRDILTTPEKGWVMYYYPGSDYAASIMTLDFTETEVTVASELDPEVKATSYYKLDANDGAAICFDTYNPILHLDATPSLFYYEARKGDFDFRIISYSEKEIVLQGRRTDHFCRLVPLEKSSTDFLKAVRKNSDDFGIYYFVGKVGNGDVEGEFDLESRTFYLGRVGGPAEERVSTKFLFTEDRIILYQPVRYNGVSFSEFTYGDGTSSTEVSSSGVTFHKVIPDGFMTYDSYLGKYNMVLNGRTCPVELKPNKINKSYFLTGLSSNFDIEVNYSSSNNGIIYIVFQKIASENGLDIVLCPFDYEEGYLTWSIGVGVIGEVDNPSLPDFTVKFFDNGLWSGNEATGFILWTLNSSGKSAGSPTDKKWRFVDGNYYFTNPVMKKIAE